MIFSPNTINDGLILYIDGANKRSYVSGSSGCTNMFGQVSGSLTNGVVFTSENKGIFDIDGVDDHIKFDSSTFSTSSFDFERTDKFSIECWVCVESFPTDASAGIVTKYSNPPSRGYHFSLYNTGGNSYLRFDLQNNGGTNGIIKWSGTTLSTAKWYNFVVTYDGSSDVSGATLYINGTAEASPTNNSNTLSATTLSSQPLVVGGILTPTRMFDGKINCVKIYNKELSATEVSQNYNALEHRYRSIPTVSTAPSFTNTYSWTPHLTASYFRTTESIARDNQSPLYRPDGHDSGSAWSLFCWIKHSSDDPSTSGERQVYAFGKMKNTSGQTNRGFNLGSGKRNNADSGWNNAWSIRCEFGNKRYGHYVAIYDVLENPPPPRQLLDEWHSVMIVYNGGHTHNGLSDITGSYHFCVDGVELTSSALLWGVGSDGYTGGIYNDDDNLDEGNKHFIGSQPDWFAEYLSIDEVVILSGSWVASASLWHNSGTASIDFSSYNPAQWYRMGDGDIDNYPTMSDMGSLKLDMVAFDGTVAQYKVDTAGD